MKHYFLIAKDVGDLTTILCSALEMQQLKTLAGLSAGCCNPLNWKARRQIRTRTDFRIDNDRLNVADPDVFKRDPVNLIRFFAEARAHERVPAPGRHPPAAPVAAPDRRQAARRSRSQPHLPRAADRRQRRRDVAAAHERGRRARPLRAGVRPRRRDDAVQHVSSLYGRRAPDPHRRHADRHRARRARCASCRCRPRSSRPSRTGARCSSPPSCTTSARAATEDHSIVGARIARKLVSALRPERGRDRDGRLAHRAASDDEQHRPEPRSVGSEDHPRLRRRRAEPGAPEAAAAADGRRHPRRRSRRVERLEGPAAAHALLRDRAARRRRPHAGAARPAHRRGAGGAAQRARATGRQPEVERFIGRHYPDYWLRTEHAAARSTTRASARAPRAKACTSPPTTTTDASRPSPSSPSFAPNHPRLLSLFAGACAAAGANIVGAHIMTTRDGYALDTFLLNREFEDDEDELRRGRRIGDTIEQPAARRRLAARICWPSAAPRRGASWPSRSSRRSSSTTRCRISSR